MVETLRTCREQTLHLKKNRGPEDLEGGVQKLSAAQL